MLSRRGFLKESLALVSVGAAVPGVFGRAVIASAAERYSLSTSGKTLIVVQLAGGYDGLNMVIPYRDADYRRLRTNLGVPEADVLALDDRMAFHPAMAPMKGLFDTGKLAVVHGAGYPNPDFSHFKAMDIWQTADPTGQLRSGWLGRYFDSLADGDGHPLAGVSVGKTVARAFNSPEAMIAAVDSAETYHLDGANGDPRTVQREASLLQLYDAYRPAGASYAALLDTTLDNAMGSAADLASYHQAYKPAATYPQSTLASGLQLLAELINSGGGPSPLRVGHVTLGGFDTHTNEAATLQNLLTTVSEALAAFQQDIEAHGHADDVLTLVWSEFGRRPQENAQAGTDHGSCLPIFLMGSKVKGGQHGEPSGLSDLDGGNQRYTTDFRSVYATILESWLQAPSDAVLGGRFEPLPLLTV